MFAVLWLHLFLLHVIFVYFWQWHCTCVVHTRARVCIRVMHLFILCFVVICILCTFSRVIVVLWRFLRQQGHVCRGGVTFWELPCFLHVFRESQNDAAIRNRNFMNACISHVLLSWLSWQHAAIVLVARFGFFQINCGLEVLWHACFGFCWFFVPASRCCVMECFSLAKVWWFHAVAFCMHDPYLFWFNEGVMLFFWSCGSVNLFCQSVMLCSVGVLHALLFAVLANVGVRWFLFSYVSVFFMLKANTACLRQIQKTRSTGWTIVKSLCCTTCRQRTYVLKKVIEMMDGGWHMVVWEDRRASSITSRYNQNLILINTGCRSWGSAGLVTRVILFGARDFFPKPCHACVDHATCRWGRAPPVCRLWLCVDCVVLLVLLYLVVRVTLTRPWFSALAIFKCAALHACMFFSISTLAWL